MLFGSSYSDRHILDGIKQGGDEADRSLAMLYHRYYDMIVKMVAENQGNEEDASDLFQEVVVIFYEQVLTGTYTHKARISTYLYAVARNLWLNILKRRKRDHQFKDTEIKSGPKVELSPIHEMLKDEQAQLIRDCMAELREDCQKILLLSVFEQRPMKEIYPLMGYQSEQIARNKKYKCLNYLKKIVLKNFNLADVTD